MVGKTNKGGSGGKDDESSPINIPVSISLNAPTPKYGGHLWVKADIASQISNIIYCNSVNTAFPDGTLMIVLNTGYHYVRNRAKIKTSDTTTAWLECEFATGPAVWAVNNFIASDNSTMQKTIFSGLGMIYTKINGIVQMQDAYAWDGNTKTWLTLSQRGQYIYNGRLNLRHNIAGYPLENAFSPTTVNPNGEQGSLKFNADASVAFHPQSKEVWKRVGDVWTKYATLPNSFGTNPICYLSSDNRLSSISADGKKIMVAGYSNNGYKYMAFVVYVDDGSSFVESTVKIHSDCDDNLRYLYTNQDLSLIYAYTMLSSGGCVIWVFGFNAHTQTYTKLGVITGCKHTNGAQHGAWGFVNLSYQKILPYNNRCYIVAGGDGIVNRCSYLDIDPINGANFDVNSQTNIWTYKNTTACRMFSWMHFSKSAVLHPSGKYILMPNPEGLANSTILGINTATGTTFDLVMSQTNGSFYGPIDFSLNGSEMVFGIAPTADHTTFDTGVWKCNLVDSGSSLSRADFNNGAFGFTDDWSTCYRLFPSWRGGGWM